MRFPIVLSIVIVAVLAGASFGQFQPLELPTPSCADGRCQIRLPEPRLFSVPTRSVPSLPVPAPALTTSPCPGGICTPATRSSVVPYSVPRRYRIIRR